VGIGWGGGLEGRRKRQFRKEELIYLLTNIATHLEH
jgi:hypothetical protein